MARIKIVCETCGSEDVVRDAWAAWNVEKQEWGLENVFDDMFCEDCETSTKAEEVEIDG